MNNELKSNDNNLVSSRCEVYVKFGDRWALIPSANVNISSKSEYEGEWEIYKPVKQKWNLFADILPDEETGQVMKFVDEPKTPELPKTNNKSLIRRIFNKLIWGS